MNRQITCACETLSKNPWCGKCPLLSSNPTMNTCYMTFSQMTVEIFIWSKRKQKCNPGDITEKHFSHPGVAISHEPTESDTEPWPDPNNATLFGRHLGLNMFLKDTPTSVASSTDLSSEVLAGRVRQLNAALTQCWVTSPWRRQHQSLKYEACSSPIHTLVNSIMERVKWDEMITIMSCCYISMSCHVVSAWVVFGLATLPFRMQVRFHDDIDGSSLARAIYASTGPLLFPLIQGFSHTASH